MADEIGQRLLAPTLSYDIQMTIGDLDYSNDLVEVRILSSLITAYQIIIIDFVVAQEDILVKRLYGKDPIQLSILFYGRNGINRGHEIEKITFDLMQISDFSIARTTTVMVKGKKKELCNVSMMTVPRKPFVTMASMVNQAFFGASTYEMISSLVKSTGATLKIDKMGLNTDPIDQVLIPPMTLYQAIDFIDNHYGIYNGAATNYGFCQFDNTVNIFNLTKRINSETLFIVYHVALDASMDDILSDTDVYDGKKYITRNHLESEYDGNAKFCTTPRNILYNIKPTDSLYQNLKFDFVDICKKNGVYTGNSPEVYHDKILDDRQLIVTSSVGNDISMAFAKSVLGRSTLEFSTMRVFLERNIQIASLLRVGETVRLEPKTGDYVDLGGNYILKASDITMNKEAMNWMSSAVLTLNRTNKTNN